ncbi:MULTISPECIES: FecR family protein [unclassified Xanthobacter]|uniref:FecR family protein n=1 Tax=unclassified Xanthobacter TaxID=2623496 RepID=UPI001EDF545E|nr:MULTISPECIES: FecR family protein [unclassified Xanthobacter]
MSDTQRQGERASAPHRLDSDQLGSDRLNAHPLIARRWLLLAGITAAGLAAGPARAATDLIATLVATGQAGVGTLEAATGEVLLERAAAGAPAAAGTALLPGDSIRTGKGARAVLLLGAATRLRLGADARLRIDRFEAGEGGAFTLVEGALLYERIVRGAQPEVTVTAPFGSVIVRGTRFFIGRIDGAYGVLVLRGSARVSAGGGTVTLEPGEGTEVFPAEIGPEPPRPWSEARMRHALALVE